MPFPNKVTCPGPGGTRIWGRTLSKPGQQGSLLGRSPFAVINQGHFWPLPTAMKLKFHYKMVDTIPPIQKLSYVLLNNLQVEKESAGLPW